jgi:UPF0716 protein FxsA
MWLLLLFVVIPAAELYLLVVVGKHMGVLPTVGLIVLTGMVGWSLVRAQGMATLRRIRTEMAQGRLPAEELTSGLCLFAAGLLLLTPGFLTDTVGFLVLIPPLRRALARLLMRRFKLRILSSGPLADAGAGPAHDGGPRMNHGSGEVIDIPAENVKTYVSGERDGSDGRDRPSEP